MHAHDTPDATVDWQYRVRIGACDHGDDDDHNDQANTGECEVGACA
jgi:hypothetical protein